MEDKEFFKVAKSEEDLAKELKAILLWQQKKDKNAFSHMYNVYDRKINAFTAKYSGGNVSPTLVKAKAVSLFTDAINTYDPNKGAGFHTHLHNRMQKLYRYVNEKQNIAYVPEHQALNVVSYINTKDNLTENLGRTPSFQELAEAMHVDINDVIKLEKSLVNEINIGESADFEVFNSELDDSLQMHLYDAIPDDYKSLYEAITGIGGQPITKVSDLSNKLGLSYSQTRRKVEKLAEVLDDLYNKYGLTGATYE